jgi:hypothetical protein
VGVEGCDGFDVVALALGFRRRRQALVHGRLALEQHLFRRLSAERVEEAIDPQAPVGDGTGRVRLQNLEESLPAFREPERVQQRHTALEARLHLGIAGGREADASELLRGLARGPRGVVVPERRLRCDGQEECSKDRRLVHLSPPFV